MRMDNEDPSKYSTTANQTLEHHCLHSKTFQRRQKFLNENTIHKRDDATHSLRGGGEEAQNEVYCSLISKIAGYKLQIKNDKLLEKELKLYIPTRAQKVAQDSEPFELAYQIRNEFLNSEAAAKILLLRGEAGSGKSFFCRFLQKSILFDWDSKGPGTEEWLPIILNLSTLKDPKTAAVEETLSRDLKLTENEINLLKDPQSNGGYHLIFIFDGYDEVQRCDLFQSEDDYIHSNLYVSNKLASTWDHAKIIVTCREENICDIMQKSLLFGPICDEKTRSIGPGSFLEYMITSFSDEEITSYIKKYVIFEYPVRFGSQGDFPLLSDSESRPSPWKLVKLYEDIINTHNLKELIRIPALFSVAVNVIPLVYKSIEGKVDNIKLELNQRSLLESYFKQFLGSAIEEYKKSKMLEECDEAALFKDLHSEIQRHALIGYNYDVDTVQKEEKNNKKIIDELLMSSSLITFKSPSQFFFRSRLFQEYFIACKFEKEIIEITKETLVYPPSKFTFAQRILFGKSLIIRFLCYALNDNVFQATDLLQWIENSQKNPTVDHEPHFEDILAANAITILNALRYDFSNLNFSGIRIPGANLNDGKFEGTNFSKADLRNVSFHNAWLKGADFYRANMTGVKFGNFLNPCLAQEVSFFAYSPDGRKLAAVAGKEIVILELDSFNRCFREALKLKGTGESLINCSWSSDGKRILSLATENVVYVWDSVTGNRIKKFTGGKLSLRQCCFTPDCKSIILVTMNEFLVLNIDSGVCRSKFIGSSIWEISAMDYSPDGKQALIVNPLMHVYTRNAVKGSRNSKTFIVERHSKEASHVHKALFSLDCRQIVILAKQGVTFLLDNVRRHILKKFSFPSTSPPNYFSFNSNSTQLISIASGNFIVQNIADGTRISQLEARLRASNQHKNSVFGPAALSSNGNEFAVLDLISNKITCCQLFSEPRKCLSHSLPRDKSLNLQGAVIENAIGLSEGNILRFRDNGSYRAFSNEQVNNHFLNRQNSENFFEINLSTQGLSDANAIIIGRNRTWVNLQRLELKNNNIGDEGAKVIAANAVWVNLEKLNLSINKIGDEGAMMLGKNESWENLTELYLYENNVCDKGAIGIGENASWKNLKILDLRENNIGDQGISSLSCNKTWTRLETLLLDSNRCGEAGAKSLRDNATWSNLQILSLASNALSEKGIEALSKNNFWKNLKALILSGNALEAPGALFLSENQTWDNLELLDLSNNSIRDKGAIYLGSNTTWVNLETLILNGNSICSEGAEALTENISWQKLKTLKLDSNFLDDKAAEALSKNKSWKELKELSLEKNHIRDHGAKMLGQNVTWTKLETLNLKANSLSPIGASDLAANTSWVSLTQVYLQANPLGDFTPLNLSQNHAWKQLKCFNLSYCFISNSGALDFTKNATWTSLKSIDLTSNRITSEWTDKIDTNSFWPNLEELNLQGNPIGVKGALKLKENTTWMNLKVLNLNDCHLTSDGAAAIAQNTAWEHLELLNLSSNEIGDSGVEKLCENTTWKKLRILSLDKNSIKQGGASALGRNKTWVNLQELSLELNALGDNGVHELCKNTIWSDLQKLNLSANAITSAGIAELSLNIAWKRLQVLELAKNFIGDLGAVALARNLTWRNLKFLNLAKNEIKSTGAEGLSKNVSWVALESLNLGLNEIGAAGVAALSENLSWTQLKVLNIQRNEIGKAGVAALKENVSWVHLQVLELPGNKILKEGAITLAKNKTWTHMQSLNVSGNSIGQTGAAALRFYSSWPKLKNLYL